MGLNRLETVRGFQKTLFENSENLPTATSSTFIDNMKLPVHRWFRYSAGFSAEWVREALSANSESTSRLVLDPFAGSGTTILAAQDSGLDAIGLESHPFICRVANAKLARLSDPGIFAKKAASILAASATINPAKMEYPELIGKCYHSEALVELDKIRRTVAASQDGTPES